MTFELDFDKIKEQSMQFVDIAKKTALDLADKGKNQLDLINQQTQLSKAQRQLGALVYTLHKSGEENQPLVDKYIEHIASIEAAIEEIKGRMTADEAAQAEEAAAQATDMADTTEAADEAGESYEDEEEETQSHLTKVCPVCNAKVDVDALFCNHCGAQL